MNNITNNIKIKEKLIVTSLLKCNYWQPYRNYTNANIQSFLSRRKQRQTVATITKADRYQSLALSTLTITSTSILTSSLLTTTPVRFFSSDPEREHKNDEESGNYDEDSDHADPDANADENLDVLDRKSEGELNEEESEMMDEIEYEEDAKADMESSQLDNPMFQTMEDEDSKALRRQDRLSKADRLKLKAREKRRAKLLGSEKDPTINDAIVQAARENLARTRKKKVDLMGEQLTTTEKEEQEMEWRALQEERRKRTEEGIKIAAERLRLELEQGKPITPPVSTKPSEGLPKPSKIMKNEKIHDEDAVMLSENMKKKMKSAPMKKFDDEDDGREYIVNDMIKASEIVVLDGQGKRLGLYTRATAFKIAAKNNLDLLLVSPPDAPKAIARLVDFTKFLYYEELKEKMAFRTAKSSGLKIMQIRPVVSEHDMRTKLNHVREWLNDGYNVKIVYFQPTPEVNSVAHHEKFFIRIALELADVGVTHNYTNTDAMFVAGKLKKLPVPQHFDVKEMPMLAKLLDPNFEDTRRPKLDDGAFLTRKIKATGSYHLEGDLKMVNKVEKRIPVQKGTTESSDGIDTVSPLLPSRFPIQKGQGPKHQAGYSWYAKNEVKDEKSPQIREVRNR
jgi:translation initiation factor IF-3